jgi:5-formyltetrahydrofolate cyclo-ligase
MWDVMEKYSKKLMRAEARKLLLELSAEERTAAAAEICRRIVELPEWDAARTVGLYAAQATEPDLGRLLEAGGKKFCFPRVCGETLEFYRCESMAALRAGRWGLLEPDPEVCEMTPVSEIDLIAIPGMAFTQGGGRLGRGGGYYDRFLARAHPHTVKMGVCFHSQVVTVLPLEAHDHEVAVLVTEARIIRCGKGSNSGFLT